MSAPIADALASLPPGYCLVLRLGDLMVAAEVEIPSGGRPEHPVAAVRWWLEGKAPPSAYDDGVERGTDGRVISATARSLVAGIGDPAYALRAPARSALTSAGVALAKLGWVQSELRRGGLRERRWRRPGGECD